MEGTTDGKSVVQYLAGRQSRELIAPRMAALLDAYLADRQERAA